MKHMRPFALILVLAVLGTVGVGCAAPTPPPPVVVTVPVPQTVIVPQTVVASQTVVALQTVVVPQTVVLPQTVVVPQTVIVTATLPPAATPAAAPVIIIGGDCKVLESGGACHFVDTTDEKMRQVDVLIQIPKQKTPVAFTLRSTKPKDPSDLKGLPNPTNKPIYRNFMGLEVSSTNGDPIQYFDPSVMVTAKYSASDLDKAKGDPNKINLYWNDSAAWNRMPTVKRDDKAMTVTGLVLSFPNSDDIGDGG